MQAVSQARHESRVSGFIGRVEVFEVKLPADVVLAVRNIGE